MALKNAETQVHRLKKLDTCILSDALDKLGIKGVAFGLQRLAGSGRIAGTVTTVTLGPADDKPSTRHLCTAAVDQCGPGNVVVVEHHSTRLAAGWGGILSFAAKRNGIEGVIVDGVCRDIDEANEFEFPVFGIGAVPSTARGRVKEVAFQQPIMVRDVVVVPGDFVLADGSGIVFVPVARIDEVLHAAEEMSAREKAMIQRLKNGETVSGVMSHQYENMTNKSA